MNASLSNAVAEHETENLSADTQLHTGFDDPLQWPSYKKTLHVLIVSLFVLTA